MPKNTALFLFILASVFLFFSFIFPQQSFAQARLYECSSSAPFDYATSPANCASGPQVNCVTNIQTGATGLVDNGNVCAQRAADYYSLQETNTVGNLRGQCVNKCANTPLTQTCPRDQFNSCQFVNLNTCGGSNTFCIQYTVIVPTPTPPPTPAPTCSSYSNCSTCIVGAPFTCGWNGSSCQSGTNSCPAGNTQWYWFSLDCPENNNINRCAPTPTPIPPPPTPTIPPL